MEGQRELLDDLEQRSWDEYYAALNLGLTSDKDTANQGVTRQSQEATRKQLDFLKVLNVEHEEGISKREASDLITGALDNRV